MNKPIKWLIVEPYEQLEPKEWKLYTEKEYSPLHGKIIKELSAQTLIHPYQDLQNILKDRDQNSFLSAIKELIDNSVQSVLGKSDGPKRIKLDVSSGESGTTIITITDTGVGIPYELVPLTQMIGKASQVNGKNMYNEHGVGSKEPLAKAIDYRIDVTTDEEMRNGYFTRVTKPSSSTEVPVEKISTEEEEWVHGDSRYAIQLVVPDETFIKVLYDYRRTTFSSNGTNLLKTFRFMEEMLAFYYGDLFDDGLEIITSYDFFDGQYRDEKKLEKIQFHKVIVDSIHNKTVKGFPELSLSIEVVYFPHHKNMLVYNQTSKMSGVITKHNGKVVHFGELSYVWGTINNDRAEYNGFAVIVNVVSSNGEYPSLNTSKTALNWDDERQKKIVEEIKTLVPSPLKRADPLATEAQKEVELCSILEASDEETVLPQKNVSAEMTVDDEIVPIESIVDIAVREKIDNIFVLIEGKAKKSKDKDIYQLQRYLDIWTYNGMKVREVVLVAEEHPPSVKALAELKNGQTVIKGDMKYTINIQLKTWEELNVPKYKKDLVTLPEKERTLYQQLDEAQKRIDKRLNIKEVGSEVVA